MFVLVYNYFSFYLLYSLSLFVCIVVGCYFYFFYPLFLLSSVKRDSEIRITFFSVGQWVFSSSLALLISLRLSSSLRHRKITHNKENENDNMVMQRLCAMRWEIIVSKFASVGQIDRPIVMKCERIWPKNSLWVEREILFRGRIEKWCTCWVSDDGIFFFFAAVFSVERSNWVWTAKLWLTAIFPADVFNLVDRY